ncbi:unnamed protein product [Closterium sp. NIES-64]|nr:unnamed protein product [Closterium sp. NIES-64]
MPLLFTAIIAAIALYISTTWLTFLRRRYSLPPGPSPWPILGNLPDLGVLPYRTLAKLADRFGPILTDKICSSRPLLQLLAFMVDGGKDIVFSPADEHWRTQRRLATLHLLTARALQQSLAVREREIRAMLDAIAEVANNGDARGVELRGYLNRATLNLILRLTVGKHYTYSTIRRASAAAPGEMLEAAYKTDWEGRLAKESAEISPRSAAEDEMEGEKVIAIVDETFQVMGTFNLADFVPWLSPLDPQRIYWRAKRLKPNVDGFLLSCIEERSRMLKKRREEEERENMGTNGKAGVAGTGGGDGGERAMVDALLEMEGEGEDRVTRKHIMLLCMDMMNAGTDTTAKTVEWALAELARHPAVLERLQAEVDAAHAKSAAAAAAAAGGETNGKQGAENASLAVQEMPYLQAVIKETLRHHPPVPLLIPHVTTASVALGGYTIPPDTIIQINGWGLAHDPTVWTNPDEFDPSRFLGPSAPDVTGQDFSVLPFGSGRRGCVGMNLGMDLSARMLANFIYRFSLKLPEDVIKSGGVDLREEFSLTVALAKPLRLVLLERK